MNLLNKAEQLYKYGFAVIPTKLDKRPIDSGWQTMAGDDRQAPNGNFEKDNVVGVGVVLGHPHGGGYLHCLDVDCYDKDIAREMCAFIMDLLGGPTPYRVGQAPKFAVMVLMDEPWRKMTSARFGESKVEFLGLGQHVVAYGEHPEAKKGHYQWYNGELTGDVPTLSEKGLREIIAEFERLCEAKGLARSSAGSAANNEELDDLEQAVANQPLDLEEVEVRRLLKRVPAQGMDYDAWISVGMALHHQYEGGDAGLQRWAKWSSKSDKHDPTDMRKKYESFGKRGGRPTTFKTLIRKAKEAATREFGRADGTWLYSLKGNRLGAGSRINWLVEGIVELGTIGQVFAPPGVGKTFFVLDMAAHLAAGLPWNGHRVVGGPVVYLAGEGEGGINRRLAALEQEKGLDTSNLIVARMPNFGDPEALMALLKELKSLPTPPVMLIVDTLARATAGMDENSSKDMGTVVDRMAVFIRDLGCTVLAIHHTTKASGAEGRGSGAIKGAMDFEIRLERAGPSVLVTCAKSKDAEPFDDMSFNLVSTQLPDNHTDNFHGRISSAVIQWTDVVAERDVNLSPIQADVMRAFDQVWSDASMRTTTPPAVMRNHGLDGPAEGVMVDAVKAVYATIIEHEGKTEQELKNRWDGCLRKLRAKGVIETYGPIMVQI